MNIKFVGITVMFLVLAAIACDAPAGMDQPIGGVTATPTVKNTPTFVPEVVHTSTPTLTPTITLTPTQSIREVPCEDTICVIPDDDWDVLGRLCTVEVRGFGNNRDVACASVISTVYARINAEYLSDGTVIGTIVWGCKPDSITCQFPAHIWWGCEGIQSESCAWSYPGDLNHFTAVAKSLIVDNFDGERYFPDACEDYLYYGSSPEALAKAECTVEGGGQIEGFYN